MMTSIVLTVPIEVTVSRENMSSGELTDSVRLVVREICLPCNMEGYLNPKSGVLLIREIDKAGNQ